MNVAPASALYGQSPRDVEPCRLDLLISNTPYEVIRPTPFQHLSALTPTGEPNDDGVLPKGEVVWTHHLLPRINGHRIALAFADCAGEVLIDIRALKRKDDSTLS